MLVLPEIGLDAVHGIAFQPPGKARELGVNIVKPNLNFTDELFHFPYKGTEGPVSGVHHRLQHGQRMLQEELSLEQQIAAHLGGIIRMVCGFDLVYDFGIVFCDHGIIVQNLRDNPLFLLGDPIRVIAAIVARQLVEEAVVFFLIRAFNVNRRVDGPVDHAMHGHQRQAGNDRKPAEIFLTGQAQQNQSGKVHAALSGGAAQKGKDDQRDQILFGAVLQGPAVEDHQQQKQRAVNGVLQSTLGQRRIHHGQTEEQAENHANVLFSGTGSGFLAAEAQGIQAECDLKENAEEKPQIVAAKVLTQGHEKAVDKGQQYRRGGLNGHIALILHNLHGGVQIDGAGGAQNQQGKPAQQNDACPKELPSRLKDRLHSEGLSHPAAEQQGQAVVACGHG